MTQYNITHRCGHKETKEIHGPEKECQRKAKWYASCPCPDCYGSLQDKEGDEILATMFTPKLTGSYKQITWAESIRRQFVANVWYLSNRDNSYRYLRDLSDMDGELVRRCGLIDYIEGLRGEFMNRDATPYTDDEIDEQVEDHIRREVIKFVVLHQTDAGWWIANRDRLSKRSYYLALSWARHITGIHN